MGRATLLLLLLLGLLALTGCVHAGVAMRSMNCFGADRSNCVSFLISQLQDPFRMCSSCLSGFYKKANLVAGLQVYVNCCTRLISLVSSAVF